MPSPTTGTLLLAVLAAAPAAAVEVERVVVCTHVEEREPVGEAERFPGDVGRLYCFTQVTGVSSSTTIQHVWYYDGAELARITLPVDPPSWRTWSIKAINPAWTGRWKVVIEDGDGNVLAEVPFTISE